jgi:DNA polymerase-1
MHGLLKDILFIRKADKIVNDFLMGSMKENLCPDGKIHPSIHNTRNDEYGTRSGRFSMSNPNLQQIPSPSRDKFWGTMCRESFVPLPNCWWVKIDYSQIEYRCLAHYASGLGSTELVETYKRDPHTDYHQYVMDMTGLTRSYAKNLNFGCMYGMGQKKMARYHGWGAKYADEVLNSYHGNAPYVKHTMNTVSQVAKARGYIKTLSGRRANLVDKTKHISW